jgi:hypothetical protein
MPESKFELLALPVRFPADLYKAVRELGYREHPPMAQPVVEAIRRLVDENTKTVSPS